MAQAGILGLYAILATAFRWVCDDAFISFRYARNWSQGLGLRFNPGEDVPVEGFSNFLWTAWSALLEFLHLDPVVGAPLFSAILGAVLLVLVFRTLRLEFGVSLSAATLATAALAACPPYFIWATSGLETMPFTLLLFLAFREIVLRGEATRVIWAAVLALAVAMIRVEGVFWVIALFTGRSLGGPRNRPFMTVFPLIFLLVFGLFTLWRWMYFGDLVPNTVHAKSALTGPVLLRGIAYVASFFVILLGPLFFLGSAFFVLRKRREFRTVAVAAFGAAGLGFCVLTGGDFMAMFRFLVPVFLVPGVILLGLYLDRLNRSAAMVTGVAVVILSLLPAFDVNLAPEKLRQALHFRSTFPFVSEKTYWRETSDNTRNWAAFGRVLKERYGPDGSFVGGFIGALGYYSDLTAYDTMGLVDREVARRPAPVKLVAPGHDKRVEVLHFLEFAPDVLYMVQDPLLASEIGSYAARLERMGPADRYVVDFTELAEGTSPRTYFVYFRRLDDPSRARAEWLDAARRLEQIQE